MWTSTIANPRRNQPLPVLSRRHFLQGSTAMAGALVVATSIDLKPALAATASDPPMPNAFIRIAPDNTVTVMIKHLDKGQGIATGLTTIVADELDADWAQMRSAFAPADAAIYNNLFFGPIQGTGGSTSTANSWQQMRKAGAAARALLIAAAADLWRVPPAEIGVARGVLAHAASGRRATFGELSARASTMPVPAEVSLKDPKDWIYIGKPLPRIDSVAKTTGAAVYAMDVKRPGMLTAVVTRPPRFGGAVASFDASAARAIKGVVDVKQIPQGVAVIATDTWSALRGRHALKVEWSDAGAELRSSAAMVTDYRRLAAGPGVPAARRGDAAGALAAAAKIVEAEFVLPYLAHAPMEPLNGVIETKADGSVELWAGSQFQTVEQATVAAIFGVTPDRVQINTVWAGGSFGRRATPNADYFAEMAAIAKAFGRSQPIHLMWTREDDLTGGRYRPMALHKVRAGLDAAGRLIGWEHHIVNQSFTIGTPMSAMTVKDGVDENAVEGAADAPYAIPNFAVDWHHAVSPVTTLWWRSVGHSHTAHAVEVTIDTLAHAAGADPVAFRLGLLADRPRHAAVLKLAAEKGGFGEKLPGGRGRGIALHESFNTVVSMVADVTVARDGALKVERVVAAVDCGIAVNPDVVRAQIEGAVGYALGAALRNKITLTNGAVDQSNFDSYEPLRISDMPRVEVHIVPSTAPPTGIGEPGVPPLAPAVTNAIFSATGKRLYDLPWDTRALRGI
jgi:isoquinoline 1-oxidoreductase beta subunit